MQRRLIQRGLAPAAGILGTSLLTNSASAAFGAPLLASTVRTATLASFSGLKTGSITAEVGTLVRAAMTAFLLGRVARVSAVVLFLGIAASAIATQVLGPERPARHKQSGGIARAAAPQPKSDGVNSPLDRFGDPLPLDVLTRLGTIQRRHTTSVVGVAFASDGKAVTAQADGLLHI